MIKKQFEYIYNEKEQSISTFQVVTIFEIPVFTNTLTSNYLCDIKNIKGNEKEEEPKRRIGF